MDELVVHRPLTHSQGRNLRVIPFREVTFQDAFYIRPLVNKQAEFRVWVMCGKVLLIEQKYPANPQSVAWNAAQGGTYSNVRWNRWSDPSMMDLIRKAIKIAEHTHLHLTGIDMMMDMEGESYMVEANSAGSLPNKRDGTPSYFNMCVTKGLVYHIRNGFNQLEANVPGANWRDVIHPSQLSL